MAVTLVGIWLYFGLAADGFPGTPSACLTRFVCYCEVPRSGLARQPANTWSNIAFFPVAVWVALDAAKRALEHGALALRFGLVFALAASVQGLSSMYFHGSLTTWGAISDAVSMFIVPGLLIAVNLLRLAWLGPALALAPVLASVVCAFAFRLFVFPSMAPLMLIFAIGIALGEWRANRRDENRKARGYFLLALGLLGVGALTWTLSLRPGFPLCSSRMPWGHAAWHVIAAALLGVLWLYVRATLSGIAGRARVVA
ncbi:MAG TPA: ceramidase domain-containing protein [Polyangiaceae bacterium]|nr:ceramidase domain-containing protein [Polyangiaceae bacterium]